MLVELNIKNFAIIKDLNVEWTQGLNIITGETGTGKSILIEALSIVLGSRTSKELIRTGEKEAFLEAVFFVKNKEILDDILNKHGIPMAEDRLLIISRQISVDRPSLSKINGKNVNLSMLEEVTTSLVDIFGQFEHQSLLDVENHMKLLDSFGDREFRELKREIILEYSKLKERKDYLESISMDESERDREIDILKFQIDEIEDANLDKKRDESLEGEYKKLLNLNQIASAFGMFYNTFISSDFDSANVLTLINRNLNELNKVKELDVNIKPIYNRLESVSLELEDLNSEALNYLDSLNVDENKLYELEKRLDVVNKLKSKYGQTIDEVLEFRDKIYEKLKVLKNQSTEIEEVKKEIVGLENILYEKSTSLSNKRKILAKELEIKIQRELEDLNMENVLFKVDFARLDDYRSDGFDRVEFMISTNIGEDLKPLSKIASGGEMSRIMLAFKSILAKYDDIQTMIFDEIDTGISGRTAQIVGEKIYEISKEHQVLCISHLPQITALADSHYMIIKETLNNKTGSSIKKLSYEERIQEMARLIGGVDLTETTLKHALEMIEMSNKIK